jgi:hypothetical protein
MLAALAALLAVMFLGGSANYPLNQVHKTAKKHITDPVRLEKVLDTGKQLEKELKAMEKGLAADFGDLVAVHRAFASTEADFDAVKAKLKADQQAVAKTLLEARDAMRAQMTKAEWTAVFAAPKK